MDYETADMQLSEIKKLPVDEQEYFRKWASRKLLRMHKKHKRIFAEAQMEMAGCNNSPDE
jgi:hypothetical protein